MASALFRMVAAFGRIMTLAMSFVGFAMLILFSLGGFVLARGDVPGWWIWGYYCSPIMYDLGKPQAIIPVEGDATELAESTAENNENKKKGMVLPFEPHSITFDDIKYSVDMPQGVSGAFRPSVLTALMGVSGAGKTTLMDMLAGRKTGGYIEGNITISGYPKLRETFGRIAGYGEQNDIHSPYVTVYASMLYSAWLRLPLEVDSDKRKMFVNGVLEPVELDTLKDALVGLPGVNGLSSEQQRLTIAVELVSNPSIIFMDERTSGLDARAAAIVMRTVRNTVDTGRTVVCTIHQPSIGIFEAFDELFLTKRGGMDLYVGPVGRNSCELIEYFEVRCSGEIYTICSKFDTWSLLTLFKTIFV